MSRLFYSGNVPPFRGFSFRQANFRGMAYKILQHARKFVKIIFTSLEKRVFFFVPLEISSPRFNNPSSRNLSQRRGTIVTYDTKRNDIYGFSVPLVSSSLCFHSIRNHSGIHRKAICRARHAHRERCMNVHTRTYTHAHGWATRPWKKNRIPRQTGTFRAVFASRPQQSPLSHCRTLHESYLLNTIKGSWHNICLRGRRA